LHPMEAKQNLAALIVTRYHGDALATGARAEFTQRFSEREFPETAERRVLPTSSNTLVAMVLGAGLAPSKTEARRLIAQGGVEVNGEKVTDAEQTFAADRGQEYRLKVGKKRFAIVRFTN
jgi:tyrosyl-tRNA synthetase